jgi:hypothetical protein
MLIFSSKKISSRVMRALAAKLMLCLFVVSAIPAAAEGLIAPGGWTDGFNPTSAEGDRWHLNVSPYSYHFSRNPEHRYVWLVGAERERTNGALTGVSYFSNSFGQPSVYFYPWGGVTKNFMGVNHLFAKWTAGLLYGYKEPYENKVPFNYNGFSPAFIPALGWEFDEGKQVQVNIFGTAGLMLQFSSQIK